MKANGIARVLLCACMVLLASISAAYTNTILDNGVLRAEFDGHGLVSLQDISLAKTFHFQNDNCSVTAGGTPISTASLTPTSVIPQSNSITFSFSSGNFQLKVIYELRAGWRFVSRQIQLMPVIAGTFRVNSVTAMTATIVEPVSEAVPAYPSTGTVFLRYPSNGPGDPSTGLMLIQQNCFLNWTLNPDSGIFSMSYNPDMDWKDTYGPFLGDRVCIGTYQMSGTKFPASMLSEWSWSTANRPNDGLDWAEIEAAQNAVRAFLLFNPTKATRVNIGWCENDYQIDTSTTDGRTEYKRIMDMCNQLGIDNMLYTPANSIVAPLSENTDAWAWENVLWFNMGQQIRKGTWLCSTGTLPSSVQEMVNYAATKNLKLLAYVYPSLGFKQNPEWTAWCGGNTGGYVGADTGVRSFQDWLVQQMVDFHNHTGAIGYSFDHWWIAYDPPATSRYAQWYGCRRILENLRTAIPEVIIDGRQQYQNFGPWTWLAGTYPHPTSTDEQPASFKAFPDLHTDRVAANRQRWTAFWYRMTQLAPPEITPGFITHQTQRFDAGGAMPRTSFRAKDWDLLGWKFSLFSTIATAPYNLVVDMIPARDVQEYAALSNADKQFIKNWFDWVDAHIDYMKVTRPIIGQPMVGHVDGTSAILNDNGFIFLFNPNYRKISAEFKLDKSIGLTSGTKFIIKELEPRAGRLIGKPMTGVWNYGDSVSIPMDGTTAVVLQIDPAPTSLPTTLFNVPGAVTLVSGALQVTQASAEVGSYQDILVTVPTGAAVNSLTVNGLATAFTRTGDVVQARVRFDGKQFGRCKQIGTYDPNFTGTTITGTFSIPQRIFTQLQNRRAAWPVTYTTDDLKAPWLGSDRPLLFIHIADPSPSMAVSAKINGNPVAVSKAYNAIYPDSNGRTYMGFYIDLTGMLADYNYQIEVKIPTLAAGQFQGLFFDNIETEYTQTVTDLAPPAEMLVRLDASSLPLGYLTRWNNTGTLVGSFASNGTNPLVQNVAGRKAVVLGGSDRMTSSFSAPEAITGNAHYTVAYWVNNPALSSVETVVSWAPKGYPGAGAQFNYGADSASGAAGHTGAYDLGFNGGVPSPNTWHHIAVTYDGTTEKVYVDGILNAAEIKTLNIIPGQTFSVGCAHGLTDYFSGAVSSIQIYDQALSATEVTSLAGTWLPQPIVDLDASSLPLGTLTTWPNNGSQAASFGNDTTSLQVQVTSGRPAVTFSGTNRMKSTFTSPASVSGNNAWTYTAWVLNPTLAAEECVFTWAHRGTTSRNAQMNYGNSTVYGAVTHTNNDVPFDGGIPTAGEWHHIAVTFNGATENVYVDGKLNATRTKTLNIFSGDPMYVGCANTGTTPTAYFSGSVASLQMYNRALSPAEIITLSAGPQSLSLNDLKGVPDGRVVTLISKTVVLAPKDSNDVRSTTYFYIEELDRTCGLRVQDGLAGQDSVSEGDLVTLTGTLRTASSGERYLELSALPQKAAGSAIKPFGITTRTLHTDQIVLGELVTISGTIKQVAADGKSFTIADGYSKAGAEVQTSVVVDSAPVGSAQITVGQTVPVIGVVGLQGTSPQTAQRVLLMKELPWALPVLPNPRYSWGTSFESVEGYVLGSVVGQQSWVMDYNPTGVGTATIVSSANGQVASGSKAMQLAQPNSRPQPWYQALFVLSKGTSAAIPNQAMKYLIYKMKVYSDGGTTEYPAGSGIIRPNTWFNQFGFYPDTRYIDAGEVDIDSNFHAIVNNVTPRTVGDLGVQRTGGRWVEIIIYDNFITHTRTLIYDGRLVTSKAPISDSGNRLGNSLKLYYGTAQPWTTATGLSKPIYVDDIYIGWDL